MSPTTATFLKTQSVPWPCSRPCFRLRLGLLSTNLQPALASSAHSARLRVVTGGSEHSPDCLVLVPSVLGPDGASLPGVSPCLAPSAFPSLSLSSPTSLVLAGISWGGFWLLPGSVSLHLAPLSLFGSASSSLLSFVPAAAEREDLPFPSGLF